MKTEIYKDYTLRAQLSGNVSTYGDPGSATLEIFDPLGHKIDLCAVQYGTYEFLTTEQALAYGKEMVDYISLNAWLMERNNEISRLNAGLTVD